MIQSRASDCTHTHTHTHFIAYGKSMGFLAHLCLCGCLRQGAKARGALSHCFFITWADKRAEEAEVCEQKSCRSVPDIRLRHSHSRAHFNGFRDQSGACTKRSLKHQHLIGLLFRREKKHKRFILKSLMMECIRFNLQNTHL